MKFVQKHVKALVFTAKNVASSWCLWLFIAQFIGFTYPQGKKGTQVTLG